MSTYTDLHNRIKENLTILRKPGSKDDGMSPQKVILVNPENEFYGTFNGRMNITGGILSGLKIIGSELEGVKLDDASVDGVSLGELKTTVDVNTQDIEQLQKDAEAISTAHDALSVGLSSAVDNLSIAVNEKLDNAVEEVKKSISGVVGDVTTLSIGLGDLSTKVEILSSGMLNGVVYKGQLVLHRDKYDCPGRLFNDGPACCLLEGTQAPLKNGWMWRVSLDRENVSGDYVHVSDPNTGRELDLGKGDYIIIKNHLTSLYEVIPDDQMRMDDFDVINAQDEDDTKLAVLKQVSAYLDSKIDESLVSAEAYTDEVSASLSVLFDGKLPSVSAHALAESIKHTNGVSSEICSAVDSRLSSLSNDLSSYSNKLCSDLSTQVDAEYVHRVGDAITELSVTGQLSVSGKTTLEDEVSINAKNHSTFEVLEGGISAKTDGLVTISANEKIELKSKDPIDVAGSGFTGVFTNGVQISSTRGLDDFAVNGKTIQSTLVELSAELTGWTHAQDLELSNEVDRKQDALSTSLSTTVGIIAASLSTYGEQLCSAISTQVNAEYVHLSGDKISWIDAENLSAAAAKIKQLNALNIAGRQLSVNSTDDIVLKTGESIILSSASGIHTNIGLDKVVLAGTPLQTTIQNVSSYLDAKKLDVELASQLSTKICSDVVGSGYLKAVSVDFRYDAHDKLIKLSAGNSVYQISANDFIKDGMLENARYDAVGDDSHPNPPYIVLTFNTDAEKDDIWLRVGDLVDMYKASEDGITLSDNVFGLKYSDIKEKTGLNALSDDLYGVPGDPGAVGRLEDLQSQIDAISAGSFGVIAFTGHLVPDLNATASYSSVGAFLQSTRGEDQHHETLKVKNGASYNIYFKEKDRNNSKMISVDNAGSTLLLGNGDVLVVHDHSRSEYVDLSNLLVATDENPVSGGNVYILKAGVSRYEFEAEAKKRADDDSSLSTAIDSKIFIDGLSTEMLSAVHISEDDFHQRVKDGQVLSNELYIVSSENINAYGQQIKNLAAPELSDDAATKGYVDGVSSSLSSQVQKLSDDFSSEIRTLSTDLSASISSLTSQMELALSALDRHPLSSLSETSKMSAVIGAVLDIRDTLSALRSALRA